MKKKIYIKTAFLSLTVMSLLSSCLKDSRYIDYSGVGTLIELPLAEPQPYEYNGPGGVFQSPSFSISSASDTLTVAVNVASPKPLGSALSVTLSVTDTTTLHSQYPSTYKLLPSSDYTIIGGLTVTIPANQRLGYAKFIINTKAIGVANSGVYVLPVTIESASGQQIAQPYKALLYNINVTP